VEAETQALTRTRLSAESGQCHLDDDKASRRIVIAEFLNPCGAPLASGHVTWASRRRSRPSLRIGEGTFQSARHESRLQDPVRFS